ncbi:MAG: hypothetical protein EOR81_07435 [Mesorhizobium sp.]|nr:MAG: hypothetical protein EOR81_07435 [Mesorhizobium sp.]
MALRDSRLVKNAGVALIQPLVAMVCVFGAYRLLTHAIGIEGVGLWSLLVAGSLVARLGDVSGSGGLARFAAIELSKPLLESAVVRYINTVTLTTVAFNGLAAALLWLVASFVIDRFVGHERVTEARTLMPFAIVGTVFLSPIAATVCSAIDGTQRVDQRAILVSCSSVVLLLASWLLIPRYGGAGFGVAQILQQLVVIVFGWMVLRRRIPHLGPFPNSWSRSVFRETVGFGLRLQATGLASLLTEPLAKLILSQWGGLSFVGYYEFALRFLNQARSLVVAGAQPLVAAAAGVGDDISKLDALLDKSTKVAILGGLCVCLGAIAFSPIFSYLMIGQIRREFIYVICILGFGFGVNVLSIPFYLIALGRGVMRWNLASQIQAAVVIIVLGVPLGFEFGGYGVVVSLAAALVFSSAFVLAGNGHDLRNIEVVKQNSKWMIASILVMFLACCAGAALALELVI